MHAFTFCFSRGQCYGSVGKPAFCIDKVPRDKVPRVVLADEGAGARYPAAMMGLCGRDLSYVEGRSPGGCEKEAGVLCKGRRAEVET